jgi:H+-transporting ATPase
LATSTFLILIHLYSQIELKAEDLYDKEKVDLERVELGDVFKLLQATEEGLTSEQCAERLTIFGPNKLESEEQNPFLQVCGLL